ncbi:MAG TPA: pyridoxal-phosphate dependent enzyme [Candidatus Dormibacteraeota bacterium]|nr:pyridoxal-phosphate dependent enzyme [Candidatus Dormibacteraeota bacterium]
MATRKIHHPERGDAEPAAAPRTPLVRADGVWVKLEYLNPSGSVKDRVASHVLRDGLRAGTLRPGGEVVEPTSGNAGIALAWWAKRLGLRAVVFMPENMTEERRTIIRGHGAQLVLTPEIEGVVGAIRRAREYANQRPDRFLFDQFDDEAGVEAQAALGREALEQARRQGIARFDAVIAGVGTGGTIVGAGGAIKKAHPGTRLIAVEPEASPLVCRQLFSRVCAPPVLPPLHDYPMAVCHLQEGIGDGLVPGIVAGTARSWTTPSWSATRRRSRRRAVSIAPATRSARPPAPTWWWRAGSRPTVWPS